MTTVWVPRLRPITEEPEVGSGRSSAVVGGTTSGHKSRWGALDQTISSATNLVPTVLLARALGGREFSAFAAISVTSALAIGFARALLSEPFLIRAAAVRTGDRRLIRSVYWSAIGVGLAIAGACVLASLVATSDVLRAALLAYSFVVTGVIVQDVSRYLLFASFRPRDACLNDLAWLGFMLVGFSLWAVTGHTLSVPAGILIWGVTGGLAAFAAVLQLGGNGWVSPGWLMRTNGRLGAHLAAQFILFSGASQVALYLLGAVANLEAIGAVRATQLLLVGPVNIFFMGSYLTLLPEGVGTDFAMFRATMLRMSATLSAVAAVTTLILLAVPSSVGEALLGDTWKSARPLIIPYGLYMVTVGVATGPSAGLAALEQARTLLLVRLGPLPLTLLAPLAGAALWGSGGFVYALALTGVPSAIVWWIAFNKSLRIRKTIDQSGLHDERP